MKGTTRIRLLARRVSKKDRDPLRKRESKAVRVISLRSLMRPERLSKKRSRRDTRVRRDINLVPLKKRAALLSALHLEAIPHLHLQVLHHLQKKEDIKRRMAPIRRQSKRLKSHQTRFRSS